MATRRDEEQKVFPIKLALLSGTCSGKTSLCERYVKGSFTESFSATIGAAFVGHRVRLDDVTVKFAIWDTAGQERYRELAPMYYRGAQAAIVVYDITDSTSFAEAKSWVEELQRQASPNIVIALAGNKVDLSDQREVDFEEAQQYADENGLLFMETSAKLDIAVNEIFLATARKVLVSTSFFKKKVVIVGDIMAGKSCLAVRYVEGKFDEHLLSSNEVQVYSKIGFKIWDTHSFVLDRRLAPMYYRGAHAAIVVYDITNMDSFLLAKLWVEELQLQATPDTIIALAGCKADLIHERKVSFEEAQQYADENGLLFMETSAKRDKNVKNLFLAIAEKIPKGTWRPYAAYPYLFTPQRGGKCCCK